MAATALETLFGSSLVGSDGNSVCISTLEGTKYIGIYFSAHWCPPCRGFTPQLAKYYRDLKSKRSDFEFIFVSSDKSESEFDEYRSEMPWLAMPFADRERKAKLSKKFKVSGIPTFVIIDSHTGQVICRDGRAKVSSAPDAFPWLPTSVFEDLGTAAIGKDGTQVDLTEKLRGKYIGLYFSAHWCGPCRSFTPKLVEYYNRRRNQQGHDDFEIIFCSSDQTQESFDQYYAEMPWLALPFGDERIESLNSRFEIQGIPTLVLLSPDGEVITESGREKIEGDMTDGSHFPFPKSPIESLGQSTECYGFDINDTPSLVIFMEALDDQDQESVTSQVLMPLATTHLVEKKEEPDLIFFTNTNDSRIGKRVRELTGLKNNDNAMVILDLADSGSYYLPEGNKQPSEFNSETVGKFVQDFLGKKLPKNSVGR